MSPQDRAKWTIEAVKEWARDLFATRDEAARVARDELRIAVESLRREAGREVRRFDQTINAQIEVRNQRLQNLERDMERRLSEEREFRDEVVAQALTRESYEREHQALVARFEAAMEQYDKRIGAVESILANWQGRAVAYGVLGAIFLATVTAFVSHLLSG